MSREGYVSNYNAGEEIPRRPGCECSVQQLELVGCDCLDQSPSVFVIYRESTNQWAGWRFPKFKANERPDAREFATRQEALEILADARRRPGYADTVEGFEVIEEGA